MIGRIFEDRYEVVSKLGTGGMADVYLANDKLLGRQVALKILSSKYANDEQFIERFRREASSAACLNHPNIVQIYDRGEAEGTYFIAMEVLQGRSLKQIIVKHAPLNPDLMVSISTQIIEALRFAHRRDIIHRDIKPQNIIIDSEGRVKVTDFGIARAGGSSTMTEAGSILGTAHYLSPEQAQGRPVEAASDLYSLGIVMYEMATGKLPFVAENPVSIAMQHVNDAPRPPREIVPDFPENLEAVILRALGKKPTDRYLTADAFLDDLKRVQHGEEIAPPPMYVDTPTQVLGAVPEPNGQRTQIRYRPLEDGTQTTTIARPPKDPPKNKRRYWPLILVIVLLLALAGGAYAVAAMYDSSAKQVTVPDVVGKLQVDAVAVLSKAGLKPKPVSEASDTVEIGRVIRQDPQKDTKQREDTQVTIYISTGPAKTPDVTTTTHAAVIVPDLVGKTEAVARDILIQQGFVPDVKSMSSDKPKGTVFDQNPTAGKSVQYGATVTIYVSNSTKVTVPDLSGDTLAAATTALNKLNLVANPQYQPSSSANAGHVIGQDPLPGNSVAEHSTVTITIGTGPATTTSSTTTTSPSGTSTTGST